MKKILFALVCLLLLSNRECAIAQNADSAKLITRKLQVSFLYPIASNGMQSLNYSNKFSFNMWAGYNGGLNGVEIGYFSNNIKGDMKGLQIAGFSNVVLGKTTGCQISGFSNFGRRFTTGIQVAGFSNVIYDSAKVSQISGFMNVINGTNTGSQLSSYCNVGMRDFKGLQASGFCNVVIGKNTGSQMAGFANVATDSSKTTQLSGFANVVNGKLDGVQIAGFSNVTTHDIDGFQLSGFFNYAKKLKGVQLGFINYCDTVEKGTPIGFLSIVNKGYRALDISTNESMFVQGSFLTGVNRFYNIFSAGINTKGSDLMWSFGYGIGSKMRLSDKMDISTELSSNQIVVNEWSSDYYNILNKLKINTSYKVAKHMSIYAGASYNVLVTNSKTKEGVLTDNGIAPWSNFSRESKRNLIKMYPGFSVGIRLF